MAKVKQLKKNKAKVTNEPEPINDKGPVYCMYNPFFFRENEQYVKTIVRCPK
jgi:hypothetical protein